MAITVAGTNHWSGTRHVAFAPRAPVARVGVDARYDLNRSVVLPKARRHRSSGHAGKGMADMALASRFPIMSLRDLPELACLFDRIVEAYRPLGVFLYGSRARGDAGPDSDWDLKVVVSDDAPEELLLPMLGWSIQEGSGVYADVSCTRLSDFELDLLVANTSAQEVLRDGLLIDAR